MLQKYFERETVKRGETNHSLCAHCEGRHQMFSGMHFLLALQAKPEGAATVATTMENILCQVAECGGIVQCTGGGLTPDSGELCSAWVMPEDCKVLLTVAAGRFPLSLRISENPKKQVNCIRPLCHRLVGQLPEC